MVAMTRSDLSQRACREMMAGLSPFGPISVIPRSCTSELAFAMEIVRALRAANVQAAETLMREVRPNMVLLDWTLPETLGVTFARRLRGDQRTADIPIIMLTARAQESDKVTALDAGVDDYITKPFSLREL